MEPMSPPEPSPPLTYADLCALPEDDLRHELLDGEHVVSPSPRDAHQRVSIRLVHRLYGYLEETKLGRLRDAPYDVLLGERTVVVPDLVLVLAAHYDRMHPNGCHGAPDLVVEILSESTRARDLVQKRRLYERVGVAEYWVIDAELERCEVYRAEASTARFGRPLVLCAGDGDVLETPLLPGFSLSLVDLFSE